MKRSVFSIAVVLLLVAATIATARPRLIRHELASLLSQGEIPTTCQAAFESCKRDSNGYLFSPTLLKMQRELADLHATLTGENDTAAAIVAPLDSRAPEDKSVIKAAQKLEVILAGEDIVTFTGKLNSDLMAAGYRGDDGQMNVMKRLRDGLDSCPKIKLPDGSQTPDTNCAAMLNRQAILGHIAANNVFLLDLRDIYAEYVAGARTEYAAIDKVLAEINYDSKVKTQIYLDQLIAAQTAEISGLEMLVTRYIDATNMAAMYIQSLNDWDRDHK